jgi:hypothetical protein
MKHLIWVVFLFCGLTFMMGQNVTAPIHGLGTQTIDRLDVLMGQSMIHTSIKPYRRDDLVHAGLNFFADSLSNLDLFDLQSIFIQNNEFSDLMEEPKDEAEKVFIDSTKTFYIQKSVRTKEDQTLFPLSRKPILKHFYKSPAHLFEINTEDFYLKANPIIHIGLGTGKSENSNLYFNQRGFELRGAIDRKVYFHTQILESQVRFPNYVNAFISEYKVIPSAGFYKGYALDFLNVKNGYDFLLAQAYIGFDISKHIGLQFGHGTNFIGDGYRSLLISDFSAPYFYLKLNTRVWKFHYQNIFAELAASGTRDDRGDQRIPRKYLAGHYLSFNIRPNLTVGVYEAVIFDRGKDRFEFQYLNPIIFYRTVEGMIGSPDNAILGLTAKWNLWNKVSLYGQFVLDDIQIKEVLDGNIGWWGNKFGVQAGVKYYNAFDIDHLDLQVELNHVRPYTYTHRDSSSTYSNFNQALAHPLGANFKEMIFMARFRPIERLQLEGRVFLVQTGEGNDTLNVGTNILRSNGSRFANYEMFIGQGNAVDINFLQFNATYQLKHQMFIDLKFGKRKKSTASTVGNLSTTYFTAALRWNLFQQDVVF